MKKLPELSPHRRQVLLDALRPPAGHHLDAAVGTCFSLDLMSALLVPMAFAMFDTEDGDEHADPVALLAATQAYATDIALYCEQGRIAPAAKAPNVIAYLEESIKPVPPPEAGCFHPKLWVLRYRSNEHADLRHRILCLSRNLTFDRSWDSILRLEQGEGSNDQAEPLRGFLRYLDSLESSAQAHSLVESLAGVGFEPPPGFESLSFEPLLPGTDQDPVGTGDELLVISPFLGAGRINRYVQRWRKVTLASRGESLDRVAEPDLMASLSQTFLFDTLESDDGVAAPSSEGLSESVGLSGLHAKIYAGKQGRSSFLVVGSANATDAAFQRNVEFCIRLDAAKLGVAPQNLLAPRPDNAGLRALLRDYEAPEQPSEPTNEELELERLEILCREIADVQLAMVCRTLDAGHRMTLRAESPLPKLEPGDQLKCWPITLTEGSAKRPEPAPLAGWEVQSIVNVTGLVAFELKGRRGVPPLRFTLKAHLEGDIDDRLDAILSETLDDPKRLMRFLLLLLAAGNDPRLFDGSGGGGGGGAPLGTETPLEIPLLETLLRTFAREPGRLRAFQRTLARIEEARTRGQALPPELLEIWKPVESALEASQEERR